MIAPPPDVRKKWFFGQECINFWKLGPFIYAYEIPQPPPPPFFGAESSPGTSSSEFLSFLGKYRVFSEYLPEKINTGYLPVAKREWSAVAAGHRCRRHDDKIYVRSHFRDRTRVLQSQRRYVEITRKIRAP